MRSLALRPLFELDRPEIFPHAINALTRFAIKDLMGLSHFAIHVSLNSLSIYKEPRN